MKRKTILGFVLSLCLSFAVLPTATVYATGADVSTESSTEVQENSEETNIEMEEIVAEETQTGKVNQDLLIQSQEPIPVMEDEHPVVESVTTNYTNETSGMICLTAIVPANFGLSVYAQVENVDTGVVYNLPMYSDNSYFERCYVPAGNYAFQMVGVYGDSKNEYSFDFPSSQFYVAEKGSAEYELDLNNYDEVELQIQEKRGELVIDKTEHVKSNFDVEHEGSGAGELGITGEPYAEYFIQVKITQSGSLGEAMFSYSEDMGATWTEAEKIPLSGYYNFGSWGELTAEFYIPEEAESAFVEGDVYSFFVQDPATKIVVTQDAHSNAWPVIVSTTPDMRSFEVLEASGMNIKVKIMKAGRFGEAVWQISTDGGLTWGDEEYAKQDTEITVPATEKTEALSFILRFEDHTTNEKQELFIKDDMFNIYAERTVDNSWMLGIAALVIIVGAVGAVVVFGYKYLKNQIPSEDCYRIKK